MKIDVQLVCEAIKEFEEHVSNQLEIFNLYKIDSVALKYLIEQNKSIISDVLAFNLLINSNEPEYSQTIIRITLDRISKLSYLSRLDKNKQYDVLSKECLQFLKVYYQAEENIDTKNIYKDTFNKIFSELVDQSNKINIEDEKIIKGFPSFKNRIKKDSGIINFSESESAFQITSEFLHGNFAHLLNKSHERRNSYILMLSMLVHMAKINDWHLKEVISNTKTLELVSKYKNLV